MLARLTTEKIDVCDARAFGHTAANGFFDLGLTAERLMEDHISPVVARREDSLAHMLDRTSFGADLSFRMLEQVLAAPSRYLSGIVAPQIRK